MIDETRVEKAVNWLTENAVKAAQARADRVHTEEFRKSLKAQIMKEHAGLPLAAQEREAYADQRYLDHLEAIRQAVFQDEKNRYLLAAAETVVSAWQTQSRFQRTGV